MHKVIYKFIHKSIDKPGEYLWLSCLVLTSFVSLNTYAQSFCFLSASTYYEQVYCELQAKGAARDLPPFHQFKRNDENIQAVLLKRPAARVGIDLPLPKKKSATPAASLEAEPRISPVFSASAGAAAQSRSTPTDGADNFTGCKMIDNTFHCSEGVRYQLAGNRLNSRLADTALTPENKMTLPIFAGDVTEARAVNRYLSLAYRQYIEKMHEIGLAGVTMTYGKFSFLFYDLQEKGLNFSQRFETMYGFLKKDKANMSVSEKLVSDQELQISDCDPLSEQLLVCSRAGRNYLYVAVSD